MASGIKNAVDKVTDAIGGTVGKASAATTTSADTFVENAAIGDLYEIAAARVALSRAHSEQLRSAANKMIDDHTTATNHLKAALEMNETHGVRSAPKALDSRRETMLKHLEDAPADAFDSTYLDQQVLAHEETVSLMRSYSEGGDNPQLRSFASGTLPVVERHLSRMKALRAQL